MNRLPARAWIVTAAGMAVNLCLGILYAWSVWKSALLESPTHPAGSAMIGRDAGWHYLSDSQATAASTVAGLLFALCMVPGGRLQDRYGPRICATVGGLLLAVGCIVAGLSQSYLGLLLGFGMLGGAGMGFAYAATTPAAVKWFGPHQRGFVVGLVVSGFGAAAIYIAPLARTLIDEYGLSGSFIGLGCFFAIVVTIAGQFLKPPPLGYTPPTPPAAWAKRPAGTDHSAKQMLRTWQYYALVFMYFGSAQSGLLVILNAAPILNKTAKGIAFFAANAWILASFGGLMNAAGRIGTGVYSDRIGRQRAFRLNGIFAAGCLYATPAVMGSGNVWLLFLVVGVAFWQYGGGVSLIPAYTADFFGAKNLGFNYGLVFLGWGLGFLMPLVAGLIALEVAFYLSGSLLLAAVAMTFVLRPPNRDPSTPEAAITTS